MNLILGLSQCKRLFLLPKLKAYNLGLLVNGTRAALLEKYCYKQNSGNCQDPASIQQRGTKAPLAFITRCQILNDTANLGDCIDGSHMPGYLTNINGSDKEQSTEMPFEVTV